jgi:alpha-tubulin suppressor-like RCC1 family protein
MLSITSCIQKGDSSLSNSGETQDITINLLKVSPASVVIAPMTSSQFNAVGGNPPYTYAIASGLGSIDSDGLYTAPATTGNFTIKATDISGNTAFGLVVVGSALQISPSSQTMGTNKVLNFSAVGGVAPYTYSIISGLGTIDSSTGSFTSDITTGLVTVEIRDQNNNTAFSNITIVDALTLTPGTTTVEVNTVTSFTTAGGNPPYTYSIYAGVGSINASGVYTATASESTDIIRVTDNDGNYDETILTVKHGPTALLTRSSLPPNTDTTVTTSTGTSPFAFSILSGDGSIDSTTGVFTSPAQSSTTVIRITDTNGFVSDVVATTFNLKKMSMGEQHSCYTQLLTDNLTSETKCWGRKSNGLTKNGEAYTGDELSEMGTALKDTDLGSGLVPNSIWMGSYYSTCVSFTNDKIKCFGSGQYGKLGLGNQNSYGELSETMGDNLNFMNLGTTVNTSVPLENRVSMSGYHTCVLTNSGSAKCFGRGSYGALGYADTTSMCSNSATCGSNLAELSLSGGKSITKISTGLEFSCALISPDNKVKCWGRSNYGQSGQGTTTDQQKTPAAQNFIDLGSYTVKDIASGWYHTCALLNDNSVKCWGYNNYGELGLGDRDNRGDQPSEMGVSLPLTDLGSTSYPVKLYSSARSTCAIFNNGSLKCWGYNGYGLLGLGNTAHRGDGSSEMGDNLPFIDLGSGRTATHVSMDERNTCVTLDNGQLKCWGDNSYGQLGQENTIRIGDNSLEMGDSLPAIDINGISSMSANSRYGTCTLTSTGKVRCFGRSDTGNFGQESAGYSDEASETITALAPTELGAGFTVQSISSGSNNTCVIGTNGETKCFGINTGGSLGIGNTTSIGIQATQMGDNLLTTDLGSGLNATKIAMGTSHSCAILDSGDVKCWGDSNVGATGLNTTADKGDGANEMGDNLPILNLGTTAKDIATGYLSTCAILADSSVKCWGYNNYGQLGIGSTTNKAYQNTTHTLNSYGVTDLGATRTAKQISAGYSHFCALLDNDTVKCWGRDYTGQLGQETNNLHIGNTSGEMGDSLPPINLGSGLTPIKIDSGRYHNCVLFENGKVKCWGLNSDGQLGVGDTAHRGDAAGEMGDNLPFVILPSEDKVIDIEVSGYSTCVLTDKNEMKCFGQNTYGQLGQQHRYDIGTDALSMGDNLPKVE